VTELRRIAAFLLVLLVPALQAVAAPAAPAAPAEPAKVETSVAPVPVAPGGVVAVTVRLVPAAGIKVNRYPKVKLHVPAQDHLVPAAEAAVGNDAAPPAGQTEANYFKSVDPVRLEMKVASDAKPGRHVVPAKLTYYYCVAASGFCAPARTTLEIPVTVR
jgi:hypothetical protein